jgi:hypothetical protein
MPDACLAYLPAFQLNTFLLLCFLLTGCLATWLPAWLLGCLATWLAAWLAAWLDA